MNEVFLGCSVKRVSWKPAGSVTKSGKTMSFPSLSAMVEWSNVSAVVNGTTVTLGPQSIWISIYPPNTKDGRDAPDIDRINQFTEQAPKRGFVSLWGGTLTVWGTPPKIDLKIGFNGIEFGGQQVTSLNRTILTGKVRNQSGHWMNVEERYLIPGKGPKSGWTSRLIPVFSPNPVTNIEGKNVLVIGDFSVKAYSQSGTMQDFIHVLAREIHVA